MLRKEEVIVYSCPGGSYNGIRQPDVMLYHMPAKGLHFMRTMYEKLVEKADLDVYWQASDQESVLRNYVKFGMARHPKKFHITSEDADEIGRLYSSYDEGQKILGAEMREAVAYMKRNKIEMMESFGGHSDKPKKAMMELFSKIEKTFAKMPYDQTL
jgi:hypothetical protein